MIYQNNSCNNISDDVFTRYKIKVQDPRSKVQDHSNRKQWSNHIPMTKSSPALHFFCSRSCFTGIYVTTGKTSVSCRSNSNLQRGQCHRPTQTDERVDGKQKALLFMWTSKEHQHP